jgi:MFS family permease
MTRRPAWTLPIIVFAQFAGTSIWFSGNAVLAELMQRWPSPSPMAGWVTSAVQLGFIAGTLVFAILAISDRYSPRWVFLLCAAAGALFNLLTGLANSGPAGLLVLRFTTGFFLAGIYPVGMKIAAGWYEKGLGNAMGFLIGALVLGTAFPHLLKGGLSALPWQTVIIFSSGVCLVGGLLMAVLIPDGPYLVRGTRFNPMAVAALFSHRPLRASACGYFGHMWELYTLWAFLPIFLSAYASSTPGFSMNTSLWSFLAIGVGSVGCIGGGWSPGGWAVRGWRPSSYPYPVSAACSPRSFFWPHRPCSCPSCWSGEWPLWGTRLNFPPSLHTRHPATWWAAR